MTSFKQIQKVCLCCQIDFIAQKVSTKYCSLECARRAYKDAVRLDKIQECITEQIHQEDDIRFAHLWEIEQKQFLSIKECTQLYSVSRTSIYRLIKSGRLKASKVGTQRVIIKKSDITKLFD